MNGIQHILSLCFLICFGLVLISLTNKFLKKRVLQEVTINTVDAIDYPSISVCAEYSFKEYIDEEILGNISLQEKEKIIKAKLWTRNETFYFANQHTSLKDGYSCMTNRESIDPGRPCNFPFKHKRVHHMSWNCSDEASDELWCLTRLRNDSYGYALEDRSSKDWGYCRKIVSKYQ